MPTPTPIRGHWTKGKRRHPDWETTRLAITALIDEHGVAGGTGGLGITMAALGRACGVATKTVSKWLCGEHRPSPESQAIARQWLKEKRTVVKSARRRAS